MGSILTGALIGGGIALVSSGGDVGEALEGAVLGGLGGWAGGELFGALEGAEGAAAGGLFDAAGDAAFATALGDAGMGELVGSAAGGLFDAASDAAFATALGDAGLAGGASAGGIWGNVNNALSVAKPMMSMGSGVYGMGQAELLKKQALLAQQQANPWGASGGRALADAQLQELMRNPGQVAASDPAYALRVQAAQRATAGYGQNSGAMAMAGANASTDWYNARMAQLANVAGAPGNPTGAAQIGMQGMEAGNSLASQSLASLAYGVSQIGGPGTNMPPAVRQWLQSQGIQ